MAKCQGDVASCIIKPNVPSTSLDDGILALGSLENGHYYGIVGEEVDKLPCEVWSPDLDCHQSTRWQMDRFWWRMCVCGGETMW